MNIGKMLGLCCFAFNHVFFLTAKISKNSPLEKPFLNLPLPAGRRFAAGNKPKSGKPACAKALTQAGKEISRSLEFWFFWSSKRTSQDKGENLS
jgi:hypothetical protein